MIHKKLAVGIVTVLFMGVVAVVLVSASSASSAPILAAAGLDGSPRTASLDLRASTERGLTYVAREVVAQAVSDWQQVNSDGFGDQQNIEVSALEAFDGFLYAGTHNPADPLQTVDGAQIFRSSGGVIWTAVTDPGFGNSHDTAPPAILDLTVFNGYLYASTGRGNAAQIWRSPNGVNWMRVVNAGFGDPNNMNFTTMAEYNGQIYIGATKQDSEAQIWRSSIGDGNLANWTKVATSTNPASVTGFAVFNGGLYAAIQSEVDAPVQIWRSYGGNGGLDWTAVITNEFGSTTTLAGGLAEFGGYLYAGAGNTVDGAQLWRTNDGATWTQAITPGFGDPSNQTVEMVFVFQNQLYVSVNNTATGIEIWRTADGSLWEQANLDGFGDSNNSGTNRSNATAEFKGHLYVGTANAVTGGELWSMPGYEADLSIAQADSLDPVSTGAMLTYTLTITNTGPDDATAVEVVDTLPTGVDFADAAGSGWSCVHASGAVTCTRPSLALSAAPDITIHVLAPASAGTITNTASVTSTVVDPNLGNNLAEEPTLVEAQAVEQADLSITEAASPNPVGASAWLTYTLTVTNLGPNSATDITVIDTLPPGVTFSDASGSGWNCGHSGGTVTCTSASLPAGAESQIVITVTAPGTKGLITNTASIASLVLDPDPSNNSAESTALVGFAYEIFLPMVLR